jgi:PBSX family phage terminase large subunit
MVVPPEKAQKQARKHRKKKAPPITPIAPFRPEAWQLAPLRDKSPVVVLTGSAGGGKSHMALEKAHAYALKYAGAMVLLVRKTKSSMINSTLLMFERLIVGSDPGVRHYPSKSRFEYSNGSIVAYVGLDDQEARERIKSIGQRGGVDFVVMEEGTEFTESDYQMIMTRMRGRAANWRQIIIPTNPDGDQHWIYLRLMLGGEAAIYYSSARDNSYNPDDYLTTLDRLQGIDRDRLRDGQWRSATGIIFDTWSIENVTEAAEYQAGAGGVLWAVDDGYAGEVDPVTKSYTAASHPRVFLLIQVRPDGQICVFEEHHAVQEMPENQIEDVFSLPYPKPDFAVVDKSAAALKARLQLAGIYAQNGPGDVEESIKVLQGMIAADRNGWRRVLVHPRCRLLIREMTQYKRDDRRRVIKAYDHALDALRYFVWKYRLQSPLKK